MKTLPLKSFILIITVKVINVLPRALQSSYLHIQDDLNIWIDMVCDGCLHGLSSYKTESVKISGIKYLRIFRLLY